MHYVPQSVSTVTISKAVSTLGVCSRQAHGQLKVSSRSAQGELTATPK